MRSLLRIAERLEVLPRLCLKAAAWMMILMVSAIVFEVLTRRARVEMPVLTSVRLLELQWHFHVTLFMMALGYGYLRDVHVRIDIAVAKTSTRTRAWIELIGLATLFLPFVVMQIVIVWWWFALIVKRLHDAERSILGVSAVALISFIAVLLLAVMLVLQVSDTSAGAAGPWLPASIGLLIYPFVFLFNLVTGPAANVQDLHVALLANPFEQDGGRLVIGILWNQFAAERFGEDGLIQCCRNAY